MRKKNSYRCTTLPPIDIYAAEFLRFGIFPTQNSESCGATSRRNCKMFSALQSTSDPLINTEKSVQIDAFAFESMHSMHFAYLCNAIHPQTGTKLTKKAVLNLVLCCGAIWRHREKPQYRSTIHPVCNCCKNFLENILDYDFWCAQTSSFRAVLGLAIRNLTIAVCAI